MLASRQSTALRIATHAERRVLWGFIIIAVSVRLLYWFYTGRIWEDALITLTPARNLWEGFGLTHHFSEPRVHSFTSPISVLIPVIGEAFGQGILLIQICSLFAAAITILIAHKICVHLQIGLPGQIFALAFLSFNHLHIFFGMTGMETQIATCALLSAFYFFLTSQWARLGLAMGFCMLCRPDFIIPCFVIGAWVLISNPRKAAIVAALGTLVYLPWLVFTAIYYGSPIPNTILAKSLSGRNGLSANLWDAISYSMSSWRDFAPFLEYFASATTLPSGIFLSVVVACIFIGGIGAVYGSSKNIRFFAVVAAVALFFAYRAFSVRNSYFMWYIPPFTALFAISVAAGIAAISHRSRHAAIAISVALSVAYIAPLPFMTELDRRVQTDVEEAVRIKVGQRLNELMTSEDTVVMEPLGYIGFYARNKTVYDYPGLGSKIAVAAIKNMPMEPSLSALIAYLKPTYAVLRPSELDNLRQLFPEEAKKYAEVDNFKSPATMNFEIGPMSYWWRGDSDFSILKRAE
ncbi:hypothetical protein MRBLRC7O_004423 [Agrobacterium radiobacter]|uniref:hypothetical protein n=1 Tax=Agrobacterium radiobacter TaxID=362 RepID=UPI00346712AB